MPTPSVLPDRPTPVFASSFDANFGATLICNMIMLTLYGISVSQAYIYYHKYPGDGPQMKVLVATLSFLETIHAIFASHATYHYSVLSYANPALLLDGVWSLYSTVGVAICSLTQMFYARMIYHLAKGVWRRILAVILAVVLGVLIILQLGLGIAVTIEFFRKWELSKIPQITNFPLVPMFVVRVASDAVTTIALCVLLKGAQTGFSSSDTMINTLISYAINRFLLTTVVVVVQVITLLVRPDSLWAMIIGFVSASLYVNSMLSVLNSRNHVRELSRRGSEYLESPLRGRMLVNTIHYKGLRINARPVDSYDMQSAQITAETPMQSSE